MGGADLPDWTDAGAYQPLLTAGRAGFAWEWLRRDRRYREQALAALARRGGGPLAEEEDAALPWRLHAFEDPRLAVPEARPLWTATGHPWVVEASAEAAPAGACDCLDLRRIERLATLVPGRVQRLLLSDGWRSIRLDVAGAPLSETPVLLTYRLAGIAALERPLLVLRRLRALVLTGRFSAALHPRLARAPRLVTLLRASDGLRSGASQADLAAVLVAPRLERARWRVHSPSVRLQAQRLVRAARWLAAGGFWQLLR